MDLIEKMETALIVEELKKSNAELTKLTRERDEAVMTKRFIEADAVHLAMLVLQSDFYGKCQDARMTVDKILERTEPAKEEAEKGGNR